MQDTKARDAVRRSGYLVGCIMVVLLFAVFLGVLGAAGALAATAGFYARGRWTERRHNT